MGLMTMCWPSGSLGPSPLHRGPPLGWTRLSC